MTVKEFLESEIERVANEILAEDRAGLIAGITPNISPPSCVQQVIRGKSHGEILRGRRLVFPDQISWWLTTVISILRSENVKVLDSTAVIGYVENCVTQEGMTLKEHYYDVALKQLTAK